MECELSDVFQKLNQTVYRALDRRTFRSKSARWIQGGACSRAHAHQRTRACLCALYEPSLRTRGESPRGLPPTSRSTRLFASTSILTARAPSPFLSAAADDSATTTCGEEESGESADRSRRRHNRPKRYLQATVVAIEDK